MHGIGTQSAGTTVLTSTRQLLAWLQSHPDIADEVSAAVVAAEIAGSDHPMVQIRLSPVSAGSQSQDLDLVTTECYWADAFVAPPGRQMLGWLCFKAPTLLMLRTVDAVERAWARWWSFPLQWWRIALAIVMGFLAVPLTLAAIVVSAASVLLRRLIPIKWVQSLLGRVETAITTVLGDSYVFVTDDVQRVAITSRFDAAFTWLEARSDHVLVVAHSQGAAVAVEGLTRTPRRCSLVTLGSGVSPLMGLRRSSDFDGTSVVIQFISIFVVACLYVWAAFRSITGQPLPMLVDAAGMYGAWWWLPVGLAVWLADASRDVHRLFSSEPESITGLEHWRDFSSTADLVSHGNSTAERFTDVEAFTVRNRNSFLTDHSAYVANGHEFWPRVVELALRVVPDARFPRLGRTIGKTADGVSPLWQRQGRWQVAVRLIALLTGTMFVLATLLPSRREGGAWLGIDPAPVMDALRLPDWSRTAFAMAAPPAVLLAGGVLLVWVWLTIARLMWQAAERNESSSKPQAGRRRWAHPLALVTASSMAGWLLIGLLAVALRSPSDALALGGTTLANVGVPAGVAWILPFVRRSSTAWTRRDLGTSVLAVVPGAAAALAVVSWATRGQVAADSLVSGVAVLAIATVAAVVTPGKFLAPIRGRFSARRLPSAPPPGLALALVACLLLAAQIAVLVALPASGAKLGVVWVIALVLLVSPNVVRSENSWPSAVSRLGLAVIVASLAIAVGATLHHLTTSA